MVPGARRSGGTVVYTLRSEHRLAADDRVLVLSRLADLGAALGDDYPTWDSLPTVQVLHNIPNVFLMSRVASRVAVPYDRRYGRRRGAALPLRKKKRTKDSLA